MLFTLYMLNAGISEQCDTGLCAVSSLGLVTGQGVLIHIVIFELDYLF